MRLILIGVAGLAAGFVGIARGCISILEQLADDTAS